MPLPNGAGLLDTILAAATAASPWLPPVQKDGFDWTHNSYLHVPPERRIVHRDADPNVACEAEFGPYIGGGKYGGCTIFTPDDSTGLWATMHVPKRGTMTLEHEQMHADGFIHPSPKTEIINKLLQRKLQP